MRHIYTMAGAYRAIRRGERPWTALGKFMNEWFGYSMDRRQEPVSEPLSLRSTPSDDDVHWAAFCAASVEWLCERYDVPCPVWARDAGPTMREPWFHAFHPERAEVRERLMRQTPKPFARRNIYCGDRMFANKFEFAAEVRQRPTGVASAPAGAS